MEEVRGNNQNNSTEGDPQRKSDDLFQVDFGNWVISGITFRTEVIPISRPSAGPFIHTGRVEGVRPVNKCGWTI